MSRWYLEMQHDLKGKERCDRRVDVVPLSSGVAGSALQTTQSASLQGGLRKLAPMGGTGTSRARQPNESLP